MNTTTTNAAAPDAADYAAGRADWLAGHCDIDLALASPQYRHGQADERTAAVDAELLAAVARGELQPICSPSGEAQG